MRTIANVLFGFFLACALLGALFAAGVLYALDHGQIRLTEPAWPQWVPPPGSYPPVFEAPSLRHPCASRDPRESWSMNEPRRYCI